jgi:signal peptidase I
MKKNGNFFKKFWNLLWKDDSLKGWIFSIVFLFLFIRFIFFPGLSLVTGTSLPLAIVESCSMYHGGNLFSNFDNWWERHAAKYSDFGIGEGEFNGFWWSSGFNKGDILFITGVSPENIKIGDVIIFDAGRSTPIIHRVVSIEQENGSYVFSTMGDNNNGQLGVEKKISADQILGKARLRLVPYAGWLKLVFFEGGKPVYERGFCREN